MSDDDFTTLRLLRRDHDLRPEAVDASLDRARLRFDTAATATTVRTGGAAPARTAPPVRLPVAVENPRSDAVWTRIVP